MTYVWKADEVLEQQREWHVKKTKKQHDIFWGEIVLLRTMLEENGIAPPPCLMCQGEGEHNLGEGGIHPCICKHPQGFRWGNVRPRNPEIYPYHITKGDE